MENKDAREQREGKSFHKILSGIGIAAACLVCGVGVTALTARINRAEFGIYLLPFMLSVSVFIFSTLGFFLTEGKMEMLYGVCSIAGAACAIVQLALIF